jgi:hypothetical protein
LKNTTGLAGSAALGSGARTANAALVATIVANPPTPTSTNSRTPEPKTTISTTAAASTAATPSPTNRGTPTRNSPYQPVSDAPISSAGRISPRGKVASSAETAATTVTAASTTAMIAASRGVIGEPGSRQPYRRLVGATGGVCLGGGNPPFAAVPVPGLQAVMPTSHALCVWSRRPLGTLILVTAASKLRGAG